MDSMSNRRRDQKERQLMKIKLKEELRAKKRQIQTILKKCSSDQTEEDINVLQESKSLVETVINRKQRIELIKERSKEVEDDSKVLEKKCLLLANLIRQSKNVVVYTGAGISTSAQIPDYRGPNGIWTRLKNGSEVVRNCNILRAEPTFTHMAINELYGKQVVKHVVSQNCDGLHLRSGLPQNCLSEIHGNMYIEVCLNCKTQYLRSFDVTEKTSLRRHKTGRKCHLCCEESGDLIDTIVHFGEKGKLSMPLNWEGALRAASKADLILCLGSSLKVLRKYHCLWPKKASGGLSPQIAIVNLQWTPKDSQSVIKINGKCDSVMKEVMKYLNIDVKSYNKSSDPIFHYSTPLKSEEISSDQKKESFDIKLSDNQIDKTLESNGCGGWYGKGVSKGISKGINRSIKRKK